MESKLRDMERQITQLKEAGNRGHYANAVETGKHIGNNSQEVDLAESVEVCLTELGLREPKKPWFLDSSASQHVTGDKSALQSIEQDKSTSIKIASGEIIPVTGKGNVLLTTGEGTKEIPRVLYVPGCQKNLLSVGALSDQGHLIAFDSNRCIVFSKGKPNGIFLTGTRDKKSKLYRMEAETASSLHFPAQHINIAQTTTDQIHVWHRRIGHLNYQSLYHLTNKKLVTGLPVIPLIKHTCPSYIFGKQHKDRVPRRSLSTSYRPLQLIHTDLCGPLHPSLKGAQYILTFIDDWSRKCWIYCLAKKSETLEKFKEFHTMVETQTSHRLACIRSDRGGEYTSTAFIQYCMEKGIRRQLTAGYSPHQNGIADLF
jgi:transposase InsO family protein